MTTVAEAAAIIRDGGLVIYPTETCYGIGCDALQEDTVEQVYRVKERPRDKGLTVIVDSLAMAEDYARLSEDERRICAAFMPGPLTLVAEKQDQVPDSLNSRFVFRVPGNDVARRLSQEVGGPVVATSANKSGEGPYYRIADIEADVVEAVDGIIDGGALEKQEPSTIVELVDGELIVHRDGPVPIAEIEAVLHG